jgi:hypothetical protein
MVNDGANPSYGNLERAVPESSFFYHPNLDTDVTKYIKFYNLKTLEPAPSQLDFFVREDGSVWRDNFQTFESQERTIGFEDCIVECPDIGWMLVDPHSISWQTPTTYHQRLSDAITLLCSGHRPPDELITAWIDGVTDDFKLQAFTCTFGPHWAQGIAVIEAALHLAEHPTEIIGPNSQTDHEHHE